MICHQLPIVLRDKIWTHLYKSIFEANVIKQLKTKVMISAAEEFENDEDETEKRSGQAGLWRRIFFGMPPCRRLTRGSCPLEANDHFIPCHAKYLRPHPGSLITAFTSWDQLEPIDVVARSVHDLFSREGDIAKMHLRIGAPIGFEME